METDKTIESMKKSFGVLDSESLKIEKNSRGYNWEFRLLPFPSSSGERTTLDDTDIQRAERINESIMRKFGVLEA
jgi:hypothetical protein